MKTGSDFSSVDDLVNVMIVDDQKSMRRIIRQLLHQHNIDHVTEAENGKHALDLLMDVDIPVPDVILCDLHMDVMDGMEFVHHLRRGHNDTPVLILTGERNEFVLDVTRQAGASKVLNKPISAPDLVDEIHQAIGAY